MASKRYPLGIQTFSEIVKGNYFYADKTAIVYQLAHYAKFHFLSRPRRFGKSLFVSTLQAYFEGKKELFKGLAVEKMETEWTAYPVIHLDLSCGKYYSLENAKIILNNILEFEENKYGITVSEENRGGFGARLKNILSAATAQTGKQAVVLIDEYDAPMHDSVSDEELQKTIRNIMRDFFSPLKQQEGNIRFVFITGISKFSQLSIFSELNNLKILTLKDEYSSCCGITKSELTEFSVRASRKWRSIMGLPMRKPWSSSNNIMTATISASTVRTSSILTASSMPWTTRSSIAIGLAPARRRS